MGGRLTDDGCGGEWIWDREVETASPEQTLARAGAAWERQYRHVVESSALYARKFREAGVGSTPVGLTEIDRLPFSTKEELKQALDLEPPFGANACVAPERVKRVYQTSGTTGAPSVIALTARDVETWTEIGSRTYFSTGVHAHHSVLSTFGAGPFVAGHTYLTLMRIGARIVPVGPGDTERTLFALRAGLADTLLVTPSYAQYIANLIGRTPAPEPPWQAGEGTIRLTHVVTGGEPGGGIPAIRDHIQEVLGATVNEIMGIGDVSPSLFGECPEQQGMHFCGTGHVWPELVEPDTRAPLEIEPGAVGELVYTHLTREAMPVVRFLSGDVVRIEGVACACGRTSFRMRCLGRRDDMFIVRGVNVYPSAILDVVGDFRPHVTGRARVVRSGAGVGVEPPVPIEVELRDGETPAPRLAERLEAAIRAKLMFRSRVELVAESRFGASGYKTSLSRRS